MCARARRTTNALDAQIKRHLLSASSEIPAATTKRFKVVEASLLDPVAYALRDGMANDMPLSNGGRGYPLGYPEGRAAFDGTPAVWSGRVGFDALPPSRAGLRFTPLPGCAFGSALPLFDNWALQFGTTIDN